MPHSNSVINGDGIELCCIATKFLNLRLYNLSRLMQMGMTRYELRKRIGNGYDWFPEHLALHAVCNPQGTCARHTASFSALGTP